MKIRIGKSSAVKVEAEKISRVTDTIESQLLSDIKTETTDLSYKRMTMIRDELQLIATLEAAQMLRTAANIIDLRHNGVYAQALPQAPGASGYLEWASLSNKYLSWKRNREKYRLKYLKRKPSPKQRRARYAKVEGFFFLDGVLRRFLRSNGRSVSNRMGGVRIELNMDKPNKDERMTFFKKIDVGDVQSRSYKWQLGKITVRMFPLVSPGLMPGLASNQWSKTPDYAKFEKTIVGPDIYKRLVGGPAGMENNDYKMGEYTYRPLILPIVQFYTLNRIPHVLGTALRKRVAYFANR